MFKLDDMIPSKLQIFQRIYSFKLEDHKNDFDVTNLS